MYLETNLLHLVGLLISTYQLLKRTILDVVTLANNSVVMLKQVIFMHTQLCCKFLKVG